jgi:hypothetical protein
MSKLDTKSTRKTRPVRIPCGCPHARRVRLFNKTGAEDPKAILDRVYDTKSAPENIVFFEIETIVCCDRVFNI